MSTTQKTSPRIKFDSHVEQFLFDALHRAQCRLKRVPRGEPADERSHITGPELLESIRELALERFGLLARTVFRCWAIHSTCDFGRAVFDLIDRGLMSKTDGDQLSDFVDVYDFEEALDNQYRIDVRHAFS